MAARYKLGGSLLLAAYISLGMGLPLPARGQAQDVTGPQPNTKQSPPPPQPQGIMAVWLPPSDVLFDTGALADGNTACSADIGNASLLQAPLTTYGMNVSLAGDFRIADDFVVPVGDTWTVERGYVFAYQTGSTTTSTITSVSAVLWNGPPGDPASNIICGDSVANRMTTTEFTGVYRVNEAGPTCDRPIMVQTIDLSACPMLTAGTYWLDWQADGSLGSGPWAPPLAILGTASTGNAVQSNGTVWAPVVDNASGDTLGIPFVIAGTGGPTVPAITVDTGAATLTDQCVIAPVQDNGVIEPGETVQIAVPVSVINGDFHNVVASLGPAPAGVTYVTSSAALGTITDGNSATAEFEIRMDTAAVC